MNNLTPKVSVIIPIYNSACFIEMTLKGVQFQSLKDIEILLIDDCSTDNTLMVLENIAKTDKRIKVLRNKENIGVSLSRNKGIEQAKGQYITFMDHDDSVDSEMYETLYSKAIQNNSDIVHSDVFVHQGGKISISSIPNYKLMSPIDLQIKMLELLIIEKKDDCVSDLYLAGIWNKLYRTDFLRSNNVKFLSEREFSNEDFLFNLKALLSTKLVSYIPKGFYHFQMKNGTLSKTYLYRNFKLRYKGLQLAQSILAQSQFNIYSNLVERLHYRVWIVFVNSSSNEIKRNDNGKFNALMQIRNNMQYPMVIEASKAIDLRKTVISGGFFKIFELVLYFIVRLKTWIHK